MPMPRRSEWVLAVVAALVLAGCGQSRLVSRQADATYARLVAADAGAAAPAAPARVSEGSAAPAEAAAPVLYFSPRDEMAEPTPTASANAPAPAAEDAAAEGAAEAKAAAPPAGFDPMPPGSFGDILKSDLKAAPGKLWSGTKHSFANPVNLLVLSAAFGADRIVRHNLDSEVREEFRDDDSSLAETGDFGSVIGNPALHFGVAGAWYAVAVRNRDARQHELSKTLFEALAINGLSTELLKVSMNDRCPNGEKYGWPSGHTSSSVCFAAVMHEYYGLKAGLPLYALAGYSAATRLEDREHDLSDLVFGAALGWVVGHSVVKGELPQVAGFTVLPYGGASAGGLMLVKQW